MPRENSARASLLSPLSTHPSVSGRVRMEMREREGARGFYSAKGTRRPRPGHQAPLAVYIWVLAPWTRAPGPPGASALGARVLAPPPRAPGSKCNFFLHLGPGALGGGATWRLCFGRQAPWRSRLERQGAISIKKRY